MTPPQLLPHPHPRPALCLPPRDAFRVVRNMAGPRYAESLTLENFLRFFESSAAASEKRQREGAGDDSVDVPAASPPPSSPPEKIFELVRAMAGRDVGRTLRYDDFLAYLYGNDGNGNKLPTTTASESDTEATASVSSSTSAGAMSSPSSSSSDGKEDESSSSDVDVDVDADAGVVERKVRAREEEEEGRDKVQSSRKKPRTALEFVEYSTFVENKTQNDLRLLIGSAKEITKSIKAGCM